jgi:hypothetical protein
VERNTMVVDHVLDHMIININMLGAIMERLVFSQYDGTLIVASNRDGCGHPASDHRGL